MDHFQYSNNTLHAEAVDLNEIAREFNTPCYIYSTATLVRHYQVFQEAFGTHPHQIDYAVKANSNLAILNLLAKQGAGFDIVSGGELARVIAAKGDTNRITFSGVGKQAEEIANALDAGIHCFNVESEPELALINQIAEEKRIKAPIALRVNPNIETENHPYIATGLKESKFGIDHTEVIPLYISAQSLPAIEVTGIACHIGSQITELAPFIAAVNKTLELVAQLKQHDIQLQHIDLGGGLGVPYVNEMPPTAADYGQAILDKIKGLPYKIHIEPGRALVGNAGILLSKVLYIKKTPHKNFAILDCGMNDLLRPSLYQSEHQVLKVNQSIQAHSKQHFDLVGPICESGDILAKNCALDLNQGDLLAIRTCGAYGFSMSSNYNSRPRAAEILVDQNQTTCIRRRENIEDLYALEKIG